MASSEYEQLFGNRRRGGRPRLDPDEKARREALRKVEYRRKSTARNRALAVLAHRHPDEFEALMETEYKNLAGQPEYDTAVAAKPKPKTKAKA